MRPVNDPQTIEEILDTKGPIAIVGLSPKPHRDSHRVGQYLIDHGYEIIPVRPGADEVLERKAYGSLLEIEGDVEVVDVFLNPERLLPIVEQAIRKGVKYLWLQLGVVNDEVAELAREAGIHVVMDRCIKIEHGRRKH